MSRDMTEDAAVWEQTEQSDSLEQGACREMSDHNLHPCSRRLHTFRHNVLRNGHDSSGASSSASSTPDSAYMREKYMSLPTSTFKWDIHCLESLGIFYNSHPHPLPSDIFDMVYKETGVFGHLNERQKEYVRTLQDNLTFNFSVKDILQAVHIVEIIPTLRKDIDSIRNLETPISCAGIINQFITSTMLMVKYQIEYITQGDRECPVPKDAFVDMFKMFVRLCRLLPSPGSAWRSKHQIQRTQVSSESDVVIMSEDYLDKEITNAMSVVSIEEVKSLGGNIMVKKTRLRSSGSEDSDSEPSVHQGPAIYQRIGQNVLGKHGGELLLHHKLYGCELSKRRPIKYLPGIIAVGTEVTFTLLVLKADHLVELLGKGNISDKHKGYIYYSEPMDILNKKDRDLLLESFARLNNSSDMV